MPRAKTTTSKKPASKKTSRKSGAKKPATKTKTKTKTKAKAVAVDIVNDEEDIFSSEEMGNEEEFFPELPVFAEQDDKEENDDEELAEDEEEINIDDIDQQKQFFSSIAADGDGKNAKEKLSKQHSKKSIGLYRRLAIRFVILTALLIVVVAYFSFSKLTIFITPKGETINDSLLVNIYKDQPKEDSMMVKSAAVVSGTVKEMDIEVEKEYAATGEEFAGEEIQGEVTIINNYSRNQPLVATTRLLTPDNKLFRIKEAVNVPAGGEVKVGIYADKPSADMAVGLTTFTIPGLWVGLQDKIYAKNDDDFVFQQSIKKYVRASDISRANQDINELILKKSKAEKPLSQDDDDWLYEIIGSVESEIDAKVGEEKNSFTARAQGKTVAVSLSKEEAIDLAQAKLQLLIPDDKELLEFNSDNVSYSLENYDAQKGIATVKVSFSGVIALKTDTNIIVKRQLVSLNEEQLKSYLADFPEIKEYDLKFSPSFIKRAPRLPEKIDVKIKSINK